MLPDKYRLKKKSAFTATYKTRKSYYNNGITLFCGRKKQDSNLTKIGFVVSKKIHKRAVKRNRIKRLMREACRLYIKQCNSFNSPYMSVIFVASVKMLEQDFSTVNNSVTQLMEKIKND